MKYSVGKIFLRIRRCSFENYSMFLPSVALHWLLVLLFGIVSTIIAAVLVLSVSNSAPNNVQAESKQKRGKTVLNKKLLNEVLNIYEVKTKNIKIFKNKPPIAVDPSL